MIEFFVIVNLDYTDGLAHYALETPSLFVADTLVWDETHNVWDANMYRSYEAAVEDMVRYKKEHGCDYCRIDKIWR